MITIDVRRDKIIGREGTIAGASITGDAINGVSITGDSLNGDDGDSEEGEDTSSSVVEEDIVFSPMRLSARSPIASK